MEINDKGNQKPQDSEVDKTIELNDEELGALDEETQKKIQTLNAQRKSWREKAIDPETGKTYKELHKEILEASKKDKTLNDSGNPPPKKEEPSDSVLLEKVERIALRQAGVTHAEDIELARNTAKKWKMDIDEVLADEDFKAKLERQQTARANVEATSDVRGGGNVSKVKEKPEYWIAKGVPPTREDVPDRKTRAEIARSMMDKSKSGKTFYNE